MKEDINILTAFLLANIPEIITQEEFDEVKQAIENLLKGYRELKNKKYIMSISCDGECNICKHFKNEYLLVKKIAELKQHNYKGNLDDINFINKITNELQELMEENNIC